MTPPRHDVRDPEAGISLVEMLVALALFALVGLAGFATLDAIIKSRTRTEGRLAEISAIDRTLLLFGRDLQQARPGSVTGDGTTIAIADGALRLSWVWKDRALIRQQTDVAQGTEGVVQTLGPDFALAQLRYLDAGRGWHYRWPDTGSGDPRLIAVELVLERASTTGQIRKIVALTKAAQ